MSDMKPLALLVFAALAAGNSAAMAVSPLTLDHVALWVESRDRVAEFATTRLGMHEIERTDAFTLVGADARRFKLTLFAADGPREPGPLQHIALRVSDLAATAPTPTPA